MGELKATHAQLATMRAAGLQFDPNNPPTFEEAARDLREHVHFEKLKMIGAEMIDDWKDRTAARHEAETSAVRARADAGERATLEEARAAMNEGNWIARLAFAEIDRLTEQLHTDAAGARGTLIQVKDQLDVARRQVKERDAEIERLKKIADAWRSLAGARRQFDEGPADARCEAAEKEALSRLHALGI